MLVHLRYGKETVRVEVPHSVDVEVIEPPDLPAIADLKGTIVSALRKPIGSPPLEEILPGRGGVVIVVSDKTRPCRYPGVLPVLLDCFNANGVPDDRMVLLIAYGAHRHHTGDNRLFYGQEALRRVRLIHHDCRDTSELSDLGKTSRETEVRLNRRYCKAGLSIVVGSVTFHYFAGFGGGRKMVLPGLASEEGILHNHRIFVEAAEGSLHSMQRFKGRLDGNPLNEDLMEAVAMAPPSFVVNFCLNREGDVAGVFAGGWTESHRRACQFLSESCVQSPVRYDFVIASCGGYPKDIDFIQSHKTIDNAFDLVKPGGTLLILAHCEEGIGSESFLQWFEHDDVAEMRAALLKNYAMNGGTALALKAKAEACRIYLHSSLGSRLVEKMGLHPTEDVQRTVKEILAELDVKTVAVLPEGGMTVVRRE
jgi:nickel-dependent lactate racemase